MFLNVDFILANAMPCILIDQLFIYTFIKKRKEIEKKQTQTRQGGTRKRPMYSAGR
jgi:hypothetical protein